MKSGSRRLVFLPGLEEWAENRVRIVEIVVHDVNEETCFHEVGYYFPRGRLGIVDLGPLLAELECFVLDRFVQKEDRNQVVSSYLPRHEADGLHDRGLDNLFAREDTPCHRVGPIGVGVGSQVAAFIDNVVSDIAVPFNVRKQAVEQGRLDEKLEIRLVWCDERRIREKQSRWNRRRLPSDRRTHCLGPIRTPCRRFLHRRLPAAS